MAAPSGAREGKAKKSEIRVRVPVTGGFKGFDLTIFTPGRRIRMNGSDQPMSNWASLSPGGLARRAGISALAHVKACARGEVAVSDWARPVFRPAARRQQ
jgi:hypothetical protein